MFADNIKKILPANWQWIELRDLIFESTPGFACGERDSNGIIQLRMNNVDTRGNILWDEYIRVPFNQKIISKYQLQPGDVVFNNTNSTELVGKSALFLGYSEPVVYSNHFTRLRVFSEKLLPAYLAFWLVCQWQSHIFENLCNRWIGQSAVKNDKLLALEIPLPPLPEQQRIVAILNEQMVEVELARRSTEEQLEIARKIPAAILRKYFENPHWAKQNLGNLSMMITDGPHVTPVYQPNGIPFLTVRNIVNRRIDLTNVSYISPEDHLLFTKRVKAEKGDILYTKDGTLGIPCLVDTNLEFSFFVSVAIIKVKKHKLNSAFTAYALESPQVQSQVKELGAGAGLKHMVIKSIKALEIPVPDLLEQEEIATEITLKLDRAQKVISSLEFQLINLNQLPFSLLAKAFQGDI